MDRRSFIGAAAGALAASRAGHAAETGALRIAVQTEASSLDPHFALVGANQAVAAHLFDPLVGSDVNLRPAPGLTTVSNPQPDVWAFRVRDGAVFHDGTPVTAEALRFSLDRMPHVPNSPAPFVRMQAAVERMEVADERTLLLHCRGADPSVPLNGMTAFIVPPRDATTAEFNSGAAAIGSGPWRFVSWRPGDALVLARNDRWWGPRPDWSGATIRPVASDAARVAALLAGDVDLIDRVPETDLPRITAQAGLAVTRSPSARVIYIGLDQAGDASPFVQEKGGGALERNPLRDVRVRRALSMAVNRSALVQRLLQGGGRPTGQLAVPGQVGFDPDLPPPAFDVAGAKRLLAEAGYPDGFRLTLHAPSNRYVADAATAQAVAQFWTRAGVDTAVEVMPASVFFTRAGKLEFSAFLIGFGHSTGDAWLGLQQVLGTYDGHGTGGLNRGRYSDPKFDAAMEEARTTVDGAGRDALLRRAQRIAFADDVAIVPLHVPDNVWAHKASLTYEGGLDEGTLVHLAHRKAG